MERTIKDLTTEEVTHMNEILGKALVKQLALQFAITLGITVAAIVISNKMK